MSRAGERTDHGGGGRLICWGTGRFAVCLTLVAGVSSRRHVVGAGLATPCALSVSGASCPPGCFRRVSGLTTHIYVDRSSPSASRRVAYWLAFFRSRSRETGPGRVAVLIVTAGPALLGDTPRTVCQSSYRPRRVPDGLRETRRLHHFSSPQRPTTRGLPPTSPTTKAHSSGTVSCRKF